MSPELQAGWLPPCLPAGRVSDADRILSVSRLTGSWCLSSRTYPPCGRWSGVPTEPHVVAGASDLQYFINSLAEESQDGFTQLRLALDRTLAG